LVTGDEDGSGVEPLPLTGEKGPQHGAPVQSSFHDEIGPARLIHSGYRETKTRHVRHDRGLRGHVSTFAVAAKDTPIVDGENVSVPARRQRGRIHHAPTVTEAAIRVVPGRRRS
jgi:hypothetical protein